MVGKFFVSGEVFYGYRLAIRMHRHYFMLDADIDVVRVFKFGGGLQNQIASLGNNATDMVRQATVSKRNVFPFFINNYLRVFIEAS